MGDVVQFKRPKGVPEKCYFRISSPDEEGKGPIYVEWDGVSLPMLLVAEEMLKEIRDILFEQIQQEDAHDRGA